VAAESPTQPFNQPAAPSSIAVPSYVPAAYRSWVATAAAATGLPASVVAAQINDESGFNPNAVSSKGAQGIAQFEPGTWSSNAPAGSSPFNVTASLSAYIKLMGSLLNQYGGNVTNALAAYNAGPGNLPAGMGYADTILSNAGQPSTLTSSGGTGTQTSPTPAPATTSSSSSGGLFASLGKLGLRAVLTFGLLIAGLILAWEGANGILGGRPRQAVRTAATAGAMLA
jgi:hypothetical protein